MTTIILIIALAIATVALLLGLLGLIVAVKGLFSGEDIELRNQFREKQMREWNRMADDFDNIDREIKDKRNNGNRRPKRFPT